jgi:hypothetical protein
MFNVYRTKITTSWPENEWRNVDVDNMQNVIADAQESTHNRHNNYLYARISQYYLDAVFVTIIDFHQCQYYRS